jgi:hypothetical protein
MGDRRRVTCRKTRGGCGRRVPEVPSISWDGLCPECSHRRFHANNDDLHFHRGPFFEHWRRQCALAVGAVLVDDLAALLPDDPLG